MPLRQRRSFTKKACAIVQVEAGLVVRVICWPFITARCHQQIQVAIAIGVKKGTAGVFKIFVFVKNGIVAFGEAPARLLKKEGAGLAVRGSDEEVLQSIGIDIGHADERALFRHFMRQEHLVVVIVERIFTLGEIQPRFFRRNFSDDAAQNRWGVLFGGILVMHPQDLVSGHIFQHLHFAIGPDDFHFINHGGFAKAKMGVGFAAGLVTAGGQQFPDLHRALMRDNDFATQRGHIFRRGKFYPQVVVSGA